MSLLAWFSSLHICCLPWGVTGKIRRFSSQVSAEFWPRTPGRVSSLSSPGTSRTVKGSPCTGGVWTRGHWFQRDSIKHYGNNQNSAWVFRLLPSGLRGLDVEAMYANICKYNFDEMHRRISGKLPPNKNQNDWRQAYTSYRILLLCSFQPDLRDFSKGWMLGHGTQQQIQEMCSRAVSLVVLTFK